MPPLADILIGALSLRDLGFREGFCSIACFDTDLRDERMELCKGHGNGVIIKARVSHGRAVR